MREIEQVDYARVDLSQKNPFALTFHAKDHKRNLEILEPSDFGEGTSPETQDLLRTVMLAHLTARHLPKKIETNFVVESGEFLEELYRHYGYRKPRIIRGSDQTTPEFIQSSGDGHEKITYANAHSGGLDSVYRVARLQNKGKKVFAVHLRNLNRKGNSLEAEASKKQTDVLGMPYVEIRLKNGTDNTGVGVMSTRDMFLGLVTAMVAQKYGSRQVQIEGNMKSNPDAPFTDYAPAWDFFNDLIHEAGIPSTIEGVGGYEIETIGAVLGLESRLGVDLIPLVQNCFTSNHQRQNCRSRWEEKTPILSEKSPPHWCGTCSKCRRMTLGRLYYRDPRFDEIPMSEIRFFINDTYNWIQKYKGNADLLTESFLKHLDRLERRVV